MNATIVFYPHQQKNGTRQDCIPVYMRITYRRQKTEARLFAENPDSKLSLWDPITMRLLERNSPVNHYLNRMEQKFQDFMIYHSERLTGFSLADIKNHIVGKSAGSNIKVIQYVDDFFANE